MRKLLMIAVVATLTGCATAPAPSTTQVAPVQTATVQAAAHPNEKLIAAFYTAFQQKDGNKMASFYAPDAHFSDPVFNDLNGSEPGDMWRMLTAKAQDFSLKFDGIHADDTTGEAHWVATYTFSLTGRTVVNDIHAKFTFKDGKIATHTDRFDFWRWSSQALGWKGQMLGWTPLVHNKVRKMAAKGLAEYRHEHGRG